MAANVRQAKDLNGLSVVALADAVGASPRLVSKWLAADSKPSDRYLLRLADVTGRPVEWFYADNSDLEEAA